MLLIRLVKKSADIVRSARFLNLYLWFRASGTRWLCNWWFLRKRLRTAWSIPLGHISCGILSAVARPVSALSLARSWLGRDFARFKNAGFIQENAAVLDLFWLCVRRSRSVDRVGCALRCSSVSHSHHVKWVNLFMLEANTASVVRMTYLFLLLTFELRVGLVGMSKECWCHTVHIWLIVDFFLGDCFFGFQ